MPTGVRWLYCDICDNEWEGRATWTEDEDGVEWSLEPLEECMQCNPDPALLQPCQDDPTVKVEKTAMPFMKIPTMTGRPSRLVSCEQELGSGTEYVLHKLYNAKLCAFGEMQDYHSVHLDMDSFCRMEHDGTVAGEIVYPKLKLWQSETARKFEDALTIVRDAVSGDHATIDTRCGFHVHVGVGNDGRNPCYSMDAVESLYHLCNYLEDTIYRLSSANWNIHRTEGAFGNYAPPTPKDLKGKPQIGRGMSGARCCVSFQHFLQCRDYCRCGAFEFSDWANCTCRDLPKPTIEFRVFNATVNPRKIRAYIALSLALVSLAEVMTVEPEEYPAFPWSGTNKAVWSEKQTFNHESESVNRLRFILTSLPLTAGEKSDILYCAENSSLKEVAANL